MDFDIPNPLTSLRDTANRFVNNIKDPNVDVFKGIDNPFNGVNQLQKPSSDKPSGSGGSKRQGTKNEATPKPENPANPGGNVLGASTGGGNTAADLAYLDSQEGLLRNMLGRSQGYLSQGLTNLTDEYNREVSGANRQRERALSDFNVREQDTTRAKDEALRRVDTNARVLNNSLRQILGLASGSGSSAYQYAAPNAVARQASGERGGVLNNFGENFRDLDTARTRATEDFETLLSDLGRQRAGKERELRSGILESEQDINTKLADIAAKRAAARGGNFAAIRSAQAPFEAEINSRSNAIDSLFERFRSPQLTTREINVQTPELRDYTVDRAGVQGGQQGNPYEPYYSPLRRQAEEELGLF